MKNTYIKPIVEIVSWEKADVITTSSVGYDLNASSVGDSNVTLNLTYSQISGSQNQ